MPLSNREKQARWRDRNVVTLTADAADIALKLIEMDDQKKLRKIASYVTDHLRHPDRTPDEREIATGRHSMDGVNGRLSKTEALAQMRKPIQNHSFRIEATTADGRRWGNGVRLATQEEAAVYVESFAAYDLAERGYVTSAIIRCDDTPTNSITRTRKGGRPRLVFDHGTCDSLIWREVIRDGEIRIE